MRQKANVTAPSENEAQNCMKDYANANSQLKKIEAEIELKVLKVKERYKEQIEILSGTKQTTFQKLQAYAQTNRDTLFQKRKSFDMLHGVLGFRTGTPKVGKKAGITWQAMLELFKSQKKNAFIRKKEEIDKDKILASRENEAVMKELESLGIKVSQDESFFVEPKEETIAG